MALAVVVLVNAASCVVDVDRQYIMPPCTVSFKESVLQHYTDKQWKKNSRMKRATLMKICDDFVTRSN